jgi:GNAT superfamily N-acetyltransferase
MSVAERSGAHVAPDTLEVSVTAVQHTRTGVRKATPTHYDAVSRVLTAAFLDDPVFGWIFPDPVRRSVLTRHFFDLTVAALAPHDHMWITRDDITGAALWVPHGTAAMPDDEAERFAGTLADLAGPDAGRLLELMALLDGHHPTDPHEYLWFLGVVPAAQGRGVGGDLMRPGLDRADGADVPAYLEATSSRSKTLYERHGFVATAPIAVAGGPPLWPMWRRPARRTVVTRPRSGRGL